MTYKPTILSRIIQTQIPAIIEGTTTLLQQAQRTCSLSLNTGCQAPNAHYNLRWFELNCINEESLLCVMTSLPSTESSRASAWAPVQKADWNLGLVSAWQRNPDVSTWGNQVSIISYLDAGNPISCLHESNELCGLEQGDTSPRRNDCSEAVLTYLNTKAIIRSSLQLPETRLVLVFVQ